MMTKAAPVLPKAFEFSGESAREVAAFLGLERGGTLELEIADYLRGAAVETPEAELSANHNCILWDPLSSRLIIQGRWYDWQGLRPRRRGPRFSFDGPQDLNQKSLALFKNWARVHQRLQAHGKPMGKPGADLRRALSFSMEADSVRRGPWWRRAGSRLFSRRQTILFESITERSGKGLWLEVRLGPALR